MLFVKAGPSFPAMIVAENPSLWRSFNRFRRFSVQLTGMRRFLQPRLFGRVGRRFTLHKAWDQGLGRRHRDPRADRSLIDPCYRPDASLFRDSGNPCSSEPPDGQVKTSPLRLAWSPRGHRNVIGRPSRKALSGYVLDFTRERVVPQERLELPTPSLRMRCSTN